MTPRQLSGCALLAAAAFASTPAPAEDKVALVIGNAAYAAAPLRNPLNDANAIAARLRALGFEVTLRTNVTQREMTRSVSQFGQALKPGSVALFYYAGHGMQVRGRNFLIPVDADIQSEASARSESVDLDLVLEQLGPTRLSMVILDACRNNPFEGRFRSTRGSGLAQVDAPKGTLLAYATAPGKVASDGEGANGLYTAELLKAMDTPGAKVEDVFKAVRVNVIKATAGEQIPWESSSLTGDYYFRPAAQKAEGAKASRDTEARAEIQARLDAERRAREQEAQALKAEMEKLREEVRRLSAASTATAAAEPTSPAPPTAAAAAPAEAKPAPAATKTPAPRTEAPASKPEGKPAAPPPTRPPGERVKLAKADPDASKAGLRLAAEKEWKRRLEVLEGQRGQLTFSKASAVLFGPLTDEQLTELIGKERALRDLPYSSAFAMGVNARGGIAAWRVWRERSGPIAAEYAVERCSRVSTTRCVAVMVDGGFREDAFLAWARGLSGAQLLQLRGELLRLRVTQQ
jgi:uncharacterized caspase-like protein